MGLVLRNIKNSFMAYRSIYAQLIVTQLVAVIILLFVYGIVVSYDIAKEEEKMEKLYFDARFTERVSTAELREILPEVLDVVEDRVDFLYMGGNFEGNEARISFHEEYHGGKFRLSETVFSQGSLSDGRLMTESEMNDGSRVLIGYNVGNVGDTYIVAGEEFEVIGVLRETPSNVTLHIPLSSANEEFTTGFVSLFFDKLPTKSDYDTFVTVLKRHYGDNVQFNDFEPMNIDDIIAYDSIIVLALAIGVVAALDTILVYNYLMKKRKKQMAIFGIEGATRLQQILINEAEVAIITVITSLTGVVLFRLAVEQVIMEVYEIGISIFSIKVYGLMLLAFIGCILFGTFVMTVINTRKKALDMRRG